MVRSAECGEGQICSGKGTCFTNASMEHFQCRCCDTYTGSHCEELDACEPNPCLNSGICVDIQEGHDGDTFQCLCPYGGSLSQDLMHIIILIGLRSFGQKEPFVLCAFIGLSKPRLENAAVVGEASQPGRESAQKRTDDQVALRFMTWAPGPNVLRRLSRPRQKTRSPAAHRHHLATPISGQLQPPSFRNERSVLGARLFSAKFITCPALWEALGSSQSLSSDSEPRRGLTATRLWRSWYEEGYRGRYCEEWTNLCESRPCQNGGTCTGNHSAYTCLCSPGWTGTQCSEREEVTELSSNNDEACANSPCIHGVCVETQSQGVRCFCLPDPSMLPAVAGERVTPCRDGPLICCSCRGGLFFGVMRRYIVSLLGPLPGLLAEIRRRCGTLLRRSLHPFLLACGELRSVFTEAGHLSAWYEAPTTRRRGSWGACHGPCGPLQLRLPGWPRWRTPERAVQKAKKGASSREIRAFLGSTPGSSADASGGQGSSPGDCLRPPAPLMGGFCSSSGAPSLFMEYASN
ncbi:hypothetical protein C7M84_021816 [Penaeus vannamei]|uniref:EGF-like domain-containing protein n=1 Tax=Penaeus vannamei TaxID=6689 RepID=A0A423S8V0_PENVA|nr:hypothetical protein C7M84_021816 [Penaeus vannamei]